MELQAEILVKALEGGTVRVEFPNSQLNAAEIVDAASYRALQRIKAVINDDSLSDAECFRRIEEIVCVFEELGSNSGGRHDFGYKLTRRTCNFP